MGSKIMPRGKVRLLAMVSKTNPSAACGLVTGATDGHVDCALTKMLSSDPAKRRKSVIVGEGKAIERQPSAKIYTVRMHLEHASAFIDLLKSTEIKSTIHINIPCGSL